jgi:uncharacterized protein with FMN-binding domain
MVEMGLKRLASLALFIILLPVFAGCREKEVKYIPGSYENAGEGYYSTLHVLVTVDAYEIKSIEILSHEEPQILADIVFEKLPPKIIKKNGTDVDIVSGATYTSRALLDAVRKALEQAEVGNDEAAD